MYQVPGDEELCHTCRKWADAEKSSLISAIPAQMQAAVAARLIEPPARLDLNLVSLYFATASISLVFGVVVSDFLPLLYK